MKRFSKIFMIAAMFVFLAGTIVQAHPSNCHNGCMMNANCLNMQNCELQTCAKHGCNNARCANSKYCKNHNVTNVKPQYNSYGHHGHHGR